MDNYIAAIEEIGFVKTGENNKNAVFTTHFKHKGIIFDLQHCENYYNIFTSKRRARVLTTEKEFNVYKIAEQQFPLAIKSIALYWKLTKETK